MDCKGRRLRETLLVLAAVQLAGSLGMGPAPFAYSCPQFCLCERRTRSVSCRGNLFTAVPADVPRDTRTLQLHGQNFTVLARLAAGPMRALRALDLAQNGVAFVSDAALAGLPRLKRLDLSYNYLDRVPAAVARASSLKELILHHNRLRALHRDDFANLTC